MTFPIRFPASAQQRQFYNLYRLGAGEAYHVVSAFKIQGNLDIEILEKALESLVMRHDALRTSLEEIDGRVEQIIHQVHPSMYHVQRIKILQAHLNCTDNDYASLLRPTIQEHFDLDRPPLFRSAVFLSNTTPLLLCFVMHHAIFDLRSKSLFAAELSGFYEEILHEILPIKPPAIQYTDYCMYQKELLGSPEASKMIDFWQNAVKNCPRSLTLPTDRPRPEIPTFDGSVFQFSVPGSITSILAEYTDDENTDPYLVFLACYFLLLRMYSGQSDVCIGIPLTNRKNNRFTDCMGCFVATVPLCLNLHNGMTFSEILKTVRKGMLLLHRNQEIPFETIVERSGFTADQGVNPLFQTAFTFEHPMTLSLSGADLKIFPIHHGGSQLDTFLTLWNDEGVWRGTYEYNSRLFDHSTIEAMMNEYFTILNGALIDPVSPADELPISCPSVLSGKKDERKKDEEPLTVDRLICESIVRNGSRIAITDEQFSLTYRELGSRVQTQYSRLHDYGIKPGTNVGICLKRNADMVVALLAVLEIGASYVPLDPGFPASRLELMIDDAQLNFFIVDETTIGVLTLPPDAIVVKSNNIEPPARPATVALPFVSAARPESIAYIIYTSGSTGRPKGVEIPHSAVVNFLHSMQREPGISDNDTLLAVTTLSFDIAVLELLLPLTVGATVYIAPERTVVDGYELINLLDKCGATIMQATPSTWQLLMEASWKGTPGLKVLCGGEPLSRELANELLERSVELWNMYGPTEATVWCSCRKIGRSNSAITLGQPVLNCTIELRNDRMLQVPCGATGELYLSGAPLALGYHGNPSLTSSVFLQDPLTGKRLYKTGDLARMNGEGELLFLGRIDNQVKLRGYRIELGDIESAMSSFNTISRAVVILRSINGHDQLVGYYTTIDGTILDEAQLRSHVAGLIPRYMVPAFFVHQHHFPVTPNGKIDRKGLLQEVGMISTDTVAVKPPSGVTEKMLVIIWQKILARPSIDPTESFFSMGGTSLLAIKLIVELSAQTGMQLPVLELFKYPTVESFAKFIDNMQVTSNNLQASVLRGQQRRQHAGKRIGKDISGIK